jgi:pimeloyl-ACP methyl ester carboxylesterase/DNA-binding winged helix-turn-helix (wHTH) protein
MSCGGGGVLRFVFNGYSLDVGRRELRRGAELIAVEPQVFDLLTYLIENRERVVSKDDIIASVWGGRIVSESTLSSRITAVRKAVGDTGKHQALIRTMSRKGVRFVGAVAEADAISTPQPLSEPRQEIRFCTTSDGVRIAYAMTGNGPAVLKAANWLSHTEYDWVNPIWGNLLRGLSSEHRLVRYDERGTGLSDRQAAEISFETFVRDLECVADAAELPRFALLGASRGCAACIAYAARHPERVSRLILYGGYARGRQHRGSATGQADAFLTLFREGFSPENRTIRQMLKYSIFPGATDEQLEWFNDLQEMTTSPEIAMRIRRATFDIDITDLLPRVSAPTLVLHCRHDPAEPFDEARLIAAGIPGSRLVALEGRNHLLFDSEPAWSRLRQEITSFLN